VKKSLLTKKKLSFHSGRFSAGARGSAEASHPAPAAQVHGSSRPQRGGRGGSGGGAPQHIHRRRGAGDRAAAAFAQGAARRGCVQPPAEQELGQGENQTLSSAEIHPF